MPISNLLYNARDSLRQGANMRFEKITIENFKNVVHGELSFENKRRPDGPSILALYGQNGSGKSALIDCLLAFKLLSDGKPLPRRFADYISKDAEFARVVYEFTVGYGREKYEVEFCNSDGVPQLLSETYSHADQGSARLKTVFTTKGYEQYGPKALQEAMVDFDIKPREDLFNEGTSLFFSLDFALGIDRNDYTDWYWLAGDVAAFAENQLFVIGTKEAESIESGELVIAYDYINNGVAYEGSDSDEVWGYLENENPTDSIWKLRISTDSASPSRLPHGLCVALSQGWLKDINYLIEQLVPGMCLQLVELDEVDDGIVSAYVQSRRGDIAIPLACESRGVQKLVSIAWLLVNVYNDDEFVAVVDEIDSGVFEYLLGEILRTVSEEGEGQLICTSHNLRPLEVMDKGYVAFTTSNPENRYMRLRNVKATNNLRDFYYRSIYLGGQKESIYDAPSSGELSMAFMMASWRNRTPDEDE